MTAVKECYIGVCGEKDNLEATLRQKFEQEQQLKEEKVLKEISVNYITSDYFQDVISINVFNFVNVRERYLEGMQLYHKVHKYDLLVAKLIY